MPADPTLDAPAPGRGSRNPLWLLVGFVVVIFGIRAVPRFIQALPPPAPPPPGPGEPFRVHDPAIQGEDGWILAEGETRDQPWTVIAYPRPPGICVEIQTEEIGPGRVCGLTEPDAAEAHFLNVYDNRGRIHGGLWIGIAPPEASGGVLDMGRAGRVTAVGSSFPDYAAEHFGHRMRFLFASYAGTPSGEWIITAADGTILGRERF